MPSETFRQHLTDLLREIDAAGLYKVEREIIGPQGRLIRIREATGQREMINLCTNNYLGLANHPDVVAAAKEGVDCYGFGMASVRFICGTQTLHRELEHAIAKYINKEDAIIFAACFDANGALFEPLLGPEDAIISDALNHASIIDGVRLSKAKRYRYASSDMNALEAELKKASTDGARFKLVITDGVFSMDGNVANLQTICDLAEQYGALVAVDDCHATGHLGPEGRGTPALTGTMERVHIVTGTFGKTLGGAMGGFIAAEQEIIDVLRQRARPYLFSNSLAPAVAAGSLKAIEIAKSADDKRTTLKAHTVQFREALLNAGFSVPSGETPIIPVMLGEARLAQSMARALHDRGVFVSAFSYPVVPHGSARIRTQMSAALVQEDIAKCIDAFVDAGKHIGVI